MSQTQMTNSNTDNNTRPTMDSSTKIMAKRCIQALIPSAPTPLIDYALASPFMTGLAGAKFSKSIVPTVGDTDSGVFLCRKMDSGNWGELSLTSPKQRKHLKGNTFGNHDMLQFSITPDVAERKDIKKHRAQSQGKLAKQ